MADVTLEHGVRFTSAELCNPATRLELPDFCDWRVFAVSHRYSDSNTGSLRAPDDLDAHQSHDGPAYIVVGADVPDARLLRNLPKLSARYGATLEQLQSARAGELVAVRLELHATWRASIARITARGAQP